MSERSRLQIVREVSKLLLPVVKSLPLRLDDRRREAAREQPKPRSTSLFRASALLGKPAVKAQ